VKIILTMMPFVFWFSVANAYADFFGVGEIKEGGGASQASGSAGPNGANGEAPSLEKCLKPLGKLALSEPQDYVMKALSQNGLPNPNGLLRMIVQQSGCFVVVERGVAFQNIQQERLLADGGQLRKGSNMGKGQLATADYVMTPEVVFKNNNAGGVGAALGGFFGPIGAVVGGALKFKEAQTTLTVSETRSGVQVAAASGSSSKADFGIGGIVGGGGAIGGLGAYENTAEGKVVAVAFLDAFYQVVKSVRGSGEMVRSEKTTKEEAGTVVKAGAVFNEGDTLTSKIAGVAMLDKPNPKSKIVAKLGKGEEVVVVGPANNDFVHVQGNVGEGWVKVALMRRAGD